VLFVRFEVFTAVTMSRGGSPSYRLGWLLATPVHKIYAGYQMWAAHMHIKWYETGYLNSSAIGQKVSYSQLT
jgi:hypothetical protein